MTTPWTSDLVGAGSHADSTERHTVIAVDLQGHGRTPSPLFAAVTLAFLDGEQSHR